MSFDIKRGDTAPALNTRLFDRHGEVIDLSSVNDVSFYMRDVNYNTVISDNTAKGVSVVDGINGEVEYQWQQGDTDEIGSYAAEFEVEFSDGTIRTFPPIGHYDVEVTEDIND